MGVLADARRPRWVVERAGRPLTAVPGGRRDEGDIVGPDHDVERVGDAVIRFHNPGPLSDRRKRVPLYM